MMIRIYTTPTCPSCKKVKRWFLSKDIPFIEKNILVVDLKKEELLTMLEKSENGTDDIISKRSKVIKEKNIDVDSMKITELLTFIKENPTVLKRPIIIDDTKILVGYNAEEISAFIPEARKLADWSCGKDNCPKYLDCDFIKGQS